MQLTIPGLSSRNSNADSDDHAYVDGYTDSDADAHVNGYTNEYAHADCDINPDDHAHADDQPDGDLRFPRRYRPAAVTLPLWPWRCLSACWRSLYRLSRIGLES